MGTTWRKALRSIFSLDPRSLAAFRMAIGVLILVDLAIRAGDLSGMYTDDGMFSRAEICRHTSAIWNWSFHFGGGSWAFQAALFAIAAGLALALVVGFETRLVTIGSWVMMLSLHHRVPPVLSGADLLLRMLLFWGMFLPLERAWSLDGWLDRRRGGPTVHGAGTRVCSVASAAVMLQMGLMYLFSAIFKTNATWLSGQAVAGALAHDFFASAFGPHLLRFPRLLTVMTWGTLFLEWVAMPFLLSPVFTARLRFWTVAALAAMHLGISLCLEVGLFSFVSMAGLLLFLPSEFWNHRLFARFSRALGREIPPAEAGGHFDLGPRSPSYVPQGLCLVFLLYVLAVNLNTLPGRPPVPFSPEQWKPLAMACGLRQKWGMFEEVPSNDGWYVAKAKLADGSEIDLLQGGRPVDWRRPAFPAGMFPNNRWHKLFREMTYYDELGFQVYRAPVAQYLCRRWDAGKPAEKRVTLFEFIFCAEVQDKVAGLAARKMVRQPLLQLDLTGL